MELKLREKRAKERNAEESEFKNIGTRMSLKFKVRNEFQV